MSEGAGADRCSGGCKPPHAAAAAAVRMQQKVWNCRNVPEEGPTYACALRIGLNVCSDSDPADSDSSPPWSSTALRPSHLHPLCFQPLLDHRSPAAPADPHPEEDSSSPEKKMGQLGLVFVPRIKVADGESKHGGGKKRAAVSRISSCSEGCC